MNKNEADAVLCVVETANLCRLVARELLQMNEEMEKRLRELKKGGIKNVSSNKWRGDKSR